MLLGDVGEVQEMRERARERQRIVDRHAAPARRRARGSRRHARLWPLFASARTRSTCSKIASPACAPQRVAEQFPEQPHVVAQRLVRIPFHRSSIDLHRHLLLSGDGSRRTRILHGETGNPARDAISAPSAAGRANTASAGSGARRRTGRRLAPTMPIAPSSPSCAITCCGSTTR